MFVFRHQNLSFQALAEQGRRGRRLLRRTALGFPGLFPELAWLVWPEAGRFNWTQLVAGSPRIYPEKPSDLEYPRDTTWLPTCRFWNFSFQLRKEWAFKGGWFEDVCGRSLGGIVISYCEFHVHLCTQKGRHWKDIYLQPGSLTHLFLLD